MQRHEAASMTSEPSLASEPPPTAPPRSSHHRRPLSPTAAEHVPGSVRDRLGAAYERSATSLARGGGSASAAPASQHRSNPSMPPPSAARERRHTHGGGGHRHSRSVHQPRYTSLPGGRAYTTLPGGLPPHTPSLASPAGAAWPASPPPGSPGRWPHPLPSVHAGRSSHRSTRRSSAYGSLGGGSFGGGGGHGGGPFASAPLSSLGGGALDGALLGTGLGEYYWGRGGAAVDDRLASLYAAWLRTVLSSWRLYAGECASALTRLLAEAVTYFLTRRAIRQWCRNLPALRRGLARVTAADRLQIKLRLRRWRALARTAVSVAHALEIEGGPRWRRRAIRGAALRWYAQTVGWRRRTLTTGIVLLSSSRRDVARGLHRWRARVAIGWTRAVRQRHRWHVASRALHVWRDSVWARASQIAIGTRGFESSMRTCATRIVRLWHSNARLRVGARRAFLRIAHSRCFRALRTWVANAQTRARTAIRRLRALRFRRRSLVYHIRYWRRALGMRSSAARLGGRAMFHALTTAVHTWRLHADERALSAALALGASRNAAIHDVEIAMMMWRRGAAGARRLRVAYARMAAHRELAALRTWRDVYKAQRLTPSERLVEHVMGSSRERSVGYAFHTWQLAWRTVGRVLRGARRALGFLLHRAIAPAFTSWLAAWHSSKRLRVVLHRARAAFHGRLGLGWRSWVAAVEEARAASSIMLTTAKRWRSRTLFGAWLTWRSNAVYDGELRRRAVSVVAALMQDTRRRALHTWVEASVMSAIATARLTRARHAFSGSGLLKAWDVLCRVQRERAAAIACMRAALIGLTHHGLHRAWLTWTGLKLDRRHAALRTLMSPAMRCKRRAWNSMLAAAATRELARTAIVRMRSALRVQAVNTWVENASRRRIMSTALARLRHRLRARGLATWQAHLTSRAALRPVMRTAIRRARHHERARGFVTWHEHAVRRRHLMYRPAARLFRVDAGRAMSAWVEAAADRFTHRKVRGLSRDLPSEISPSEISPSEISPSEISPSESSLSHTRPFHHLVPPSITLSHHLPSPPLSSQLFRCFATPSPDSPAARRCAHSSCGVTSRPTDGSPKHPTNAPGALISQHLPASPVISHHRLPSSPIVHGPLTPSLLSLFTHNLLAGSTGRGADSPRQWRAGPRSRANGSSPACCGTRLSISSRRSGGRLHYGQR